MRLYRDEALVTDALRRALARRDVAYDTELIQHTDRGSQYTADDYLALLKAHSIQVSMSAKAHPYDNAMMESFFSTLRAELTDLERFATRQAARTAVFEFIEVLVRPLVGIIVSGCIRHWAIAAHWRLKPPFHPED